MKCSSALLVKYNILLVRNVEKLKIQCLLNMIKKLGNSNPEGDNGNMENKIYKICEDVLKITDTEVNELREIARNQLAYNHPFKMATARRQHALGQHNNKVLDKLLELKEVIEQGAKIS